MVKCGKILPKCADIFRRAVFCGMFIFLFAFLFAAVPAEAKQSGCRPTEEEIKAYKKDGTWKKRQAYAKKLGNDKTSEELVRAALAREKKKGRAAGDDIPEIWKGMSVTGDDKILAVRVEFNDIKFDDEITTDGGDVRKGIYTEEEFKGMIDGSAGEAPYESVDGYYFRSSYGKLRINTDKIYSCTLSGDRESYGELAMEAKMIEEVLSCIKEKYPSLNLADYDTDGNGTIDGIYINFAGSDTGWGSTWWSHKYYYMNYESEFAIDGVKPKDYVFLATDEIEKGTKTIIHETGHMLGLPDYYDANGGDGSIGTDDMMNTNTGDHNGFSKWLLGWLEEDNIKRITKADGEQDVSLTALSGTELEPDEKKIAVIAPEDTSIHSELFVVQYDEPVNNQICDAVDSPGYRIYHVDAELSEEGNSFMYENAEDQEDGRAFIRAMLCFGADGMPRNVYREGDAFTPDSDPCSSFYGVRAINFTGINITDFKTDGTPSFHVSFTEKTPDDGTLTLERENKDVPLGNMAKLTLHSDKEIKVVNDCESPYLEREGKKYPLSLTQNGYLTVSLWYPGWIEQPLQENAEYTLVIPAGAFQIDTTVYSGEIKMALKTGEFFRFDAQYVNEHDTLTSPLISVGSDKCAYMDCLPMDFENGEWAVNLFMFHGTKEPVKKKVTLPVPEDIQPEYMDNMDAVTCHDGNIALLISVPDYSVFYKIDENGTVIGGPVTVPGKLRIFPAGTGVKGVPDSNQSAGAPPLTGRVAGGFDSFDDRENPTMWTIDFQTKYAVRGAVTVPDVDGLFNAVFPGDESSYIMSGFRDNVQWICRYDQKDELLKKTDIKDPDIGLCWIMDESDGYVAVVNNYSDGGMYLARISREGELLKLSEMPSGAFESYTLSEASWGYFLSCCESNGGGWEHYALDKNLNEISFFQLPENSYAACMGRRMVVIGVDFSEETKTFYQIGISGEFPSADIPVTPAPSPSAPAPSKNPPAPSEKPSDKKITLKKAKVKKATLKNKKLTVTAAKVKNAKGYQFAAAFDKKMKKKKKTWKTKTPKLKGKKWKYKKCYVMVRAYAKKNGSCIYGKWSKVIKIKLK